MKGGGVKWNPNFRLTINCSNGHELQVTLAEIRRNATVSCPTCHQRVTLQAQQFNRTLADVERQIRNFGR